MLAGRPARSPFSRLSISHVLAVGGDTLVTMALAGSLFFSISPQAARGRVALYLLLTVAPFALLSPLVGPAVDRSRGGRRGMLIGAAASRAVICLSMAGHLQSLWLFPEAFALLVLSKAHMVAKSALVPTVASRDQLVAANARLAVVAAFGALVAALPGLVVLRIGALGAPWVVRLGAVAFLASAVNGLRLPRAPKGARTAGERGTAAGLFRRNRVPAALHDVTIRAAAMAVGSLRGIAGFLTFLVAFAFRARSAPSWWFGLVLAISMGGSLLGSALAPRLRRRLVEERIVQGCLLLAGVMATVTANVGGWAGTAALAGTVGAASGAGKLAFDSIVGRDAPEEVRGRTFARFETHFQVAWVTGAGIAVLLPLAESDGLTLIALGAFLAFFAHLGALVAAAHRSGGPPPPTGT